MQSPKKPKSFQDILKQRQQSSFVGRADQINLFRHNLSLGLEDPQRRFIFNVWGQGGVGKTTLLRQFRTMAQQAKCLTAYIDEGESDVPDVMARLAADLEQQGHKLPQFSERYRVYRQRREELESDPDAPQGFSAFLGRTIVKSAMKLGKQVPAAGIALELVDEETVSNQAGEWFTYLAKKLTNKDEVHLLKEPLEVLTPLFLEDWCKIAEKIPVIFLFDTYERTGEFLDEWLRNVLKADYGLVPLNFIWMIAGREELDRNRWAEYEGVIARLPLEPFSELEARQYLATKGVTDERTVNVILNLSGCFPLLVAMLAEGSPDRPDQVGDPSGSAVERFLKWETDAKRRQVALDAALPRCLNQDIIAQLRPDDLVNELFDWLKQKPFVRERTDGWAYHEVVRTQMLRHKRLITPQGWAELHGKLADYYDTLRNGLQLDPEKSQRDVTWQNHTLNLLYHRLCQLPQKHLPVALNEFLAALKNQRKFAEQWAEVIAQAGKDSDVIDVQRWGEQLIEGLKAYNENRYSASIAMFEALIKCPGIDPQWQPVAYSWRGETYRLMSRYEEALQDFNRAIELDPDDAWAIGSRGETYQAVKRYEEALQNFNRAIELDPNMTWVIDSRGQTYRALKRYEEALQDFNRAIELDSDYKWAIVSRGETYQELKRYEEALQDFNRAIELDSDYKWAIVSRGETYRELKRYEEALQDFSRAIELDPDYKWAISWRGETYRLMSRYEEALQDSNRAIELDPDYKWAIANRGETYRLMSRYEEALQDFNRAIELDPNMTWAIASRGQIYQAVKRYEEALQDFNRAIELAPDYKWAISWRSETYRLMSRYEEALQDFNRAIELDPDYKWAIGSRGETYRLMSRYEEALQDFNRAIELDPDYKWAIGSRGQTYQAVKRYEEALQDLNRAIELDPNMTWAIASRGETYRLMSRYEEALQDFNRAIEPDSDDVWAIASRGRTYRALKRYEEALQDFNRAIELDPDYAWAIRYRGEILLLIKRYSEALTDLERALELDTENDWRLYLRAIAYQAMGQYESAKTDLDQAIRLVQANYTKDAVNHRNTFNLALYHLAAGNDERAKQFYRDALHRGASVPSIREALQDLEDFLTVFPDHALAGAARQVLQKALQNRSVPPSE